MEVDTDTQAAKPFHYRTCTLTVGILLSNNNHWVNKRIYMQCDTSRANQKCLIMKGYLRLLNSVNRFCVIVSKRSAKLTFSDGVWWRWSVCCSGVGCTCGRQTVLYQTFGVLTAGRSCAGRTTSQRWTSTSCALCAGSSNGVDVQRGTAD